MKKALFALAAILLPALSFGATKIGYGNVGSYNPTWDSGRSAYFYGTVTNVDSIVTVKFDNFLKTGVELTFTFPAATDSSVKLPLTFTNGVEIDPEDPDYAYIVTPEGDYPDLTYTMSDKSTVTLEFPDIYLDPDNEGYTYAQYSPNNDETFPTSYEATLCLWGDNGTDDGVDMYYYLAIQVPEPNQDSVATIVATEGPAEYYTLQGLRVRVNESGLPTEPGLYLRRVANRTTKLLLSK